MDNRSLFDGENIVLTAIDPEKDAQSYAKWSLSPEISRHVFDGFFRPRSAAATKKQLKEDLKKAEEKRNQYYFAIREKGKEELIGLMVFPWVQASSQVAHLRILFDDNDNPPRFSKEVLALALRYAFMELSVHRVSAEVCGYCEDDIHLYESAGFLRETQRRQAVFHQGQYHDELVYGLLREEWKRRNTEVK